MLPAANRLRRRHDFAATVRRGRRAGGGARRLLVLHWLASIEHDASRESLTGTRDPLVGVVVSRSVGGSVTRSAVKRRIRHQVAARLPQLPPGVLAVVRALPASATASSQALGSELDRALAKVMRP